MITLAILAALSPVPAAASGQDVVVFRRHISPPNRGAAVPRPDADQTPPSSPTASPPAGTSLDTVSAVRMPDGRRLYTAWLFRAPRAVGPGCDAKMPAVSDEIRCVDAMTMKDLPDASCVGPKPSGWTTEELSTCVAGWWQGGFGSPTPTCSARAQRTQEVDCRIYPANPQKAAYASSACDPAKKPASQDTVQFYDGCPSTCDPARLNTGGTYTWKAGATDKNNYYLGELDAAYANGKLTDAAVLDVMAYCRNLKGRDVCFAQKSAVGKVSMFATNANQLQSVTYVANANVYLLTRCVAR